MAALDDRSTVERLDPHGLLARIEALPDQCEDAWRQALELQLPKGYEDARELVVLGMGGSAIAGAILLSLALETGDKAVYVSRGYEAPAFVGRDTLVVACSHSGNTEETLSAFEQALAAGARGFAVTTGGRLQQLAVERGAAVFAYSYDGEPRSALGCQLMTLLALAQRAGVIGEQETAVREAIALMREERASIGFASPLSANRAKQLAGRLHGRLPVVVGAGPLAEAAHRWKTQINETSESWAIWEELPELGHNAIVGFGLPPDVVPRTHVVLLSHPELDRRLRLAYEATEAALSAADVSHERMELSGTSPLARVLAAVFLGDLVSYYLALLNGVAPSPVHPIDRFREHVAKG